MSFLLPNIGVFRRPEVSDVISAYLQF